MIDVVVFFVLVVEIEGVEVVVEGFVMLFVVSVVVAAGMGEVATGPFIAETIVLVRINGVP